MSVHRIHSPLFTSHHTPTLNNPRQEASEGLWDCVTRIWDAFVSCIQSFLQSVGQCFGLCSVEQTSVPSARDLDAQYIFEQSNLQTQEYAARDLESQFRRSMAQMQNEPRKSFQHRVAPLLWDKEEIKVGNYNVGIAHNIGRRPTMEDDHLATTFTINVAGHNYPVQLFGIFDGHGGRNVARYVRDNLGTLLQQALTRFNTGGLTDAGILKAMEWTTVKLNWDLKRDYPSIATEEGSTATFAAILNGKLWTANVGDSRTVLDNDGTPIQLSEDAKPNDPRYKAEIQERGGYVVDGRVNGDLAIGRSIGDFRLGGAVSPKATVTAFPLNRIRPGSHLVLCCDGVYDVSRSKDVVQDVHAHKNHSAGTIARNIIYSAYQAGSEDNLSCMVVKL